MELAQRERRELWSFFLLAAPDLLPPLPRGKFGGLGANLALGVELARANQAATSGLVETTGRDGGGATRKR